MSQFELITIVLTIIIIVLTIVGIFIGIIGIHHNAAINKLKHKWEKDEGAYDKAKLDLKIMWGVTSTNLCFYFPFSQLGIIWVPIFVKISNSGTKVAKNIELIAHGPKSIFQDIPRIDKIFKRTFVKELKFEKLEESNDLITYGFKFPKLNTNSSYQLDLKFHLLGEEIVSKNKITEKINEISVDTAFGLDHSNTLLFTLNSYNHESIIKEYKFKMFDLSYDDIKEYLISKSLELEDGYKLKLNNLNLLERIRFYLFERTKYFQHESKTLSFITSKDLVGIGDHHLEYEANYLIVSNGIILINGFILFPSLNIMGSAEQIRKGTYIKRIRGNRSITNTKASN